jgi:hypothetical protein
MTTPTKPGRAQATSPDGRTRPRPQHAGNDRDNPRHRTTQQLPADIIDGTPHRASDSPEATGPGRANSRLGDEGHSGNPEGGAA